MFSTQYEVEMIGDLISVNGGRKSKYKIFYST